MSPVPTISRPHRELMATSSRCPLISALENPSFPPRITGTILSPTRSLSPPLKFTASLPRNPVPHPPQCRNFGVEDSPSPGPKEPAMMLPNQTIFPQWVRATRAPAPLPPPKSCDCQFHIYGDPAKYPPKKNALYQPPQATFEDMRGVLKALGLERGVIVHPMPYDTDHRLLIDTLSGLAPAERKNFRATGIIKDNVSDAALSELDALGVRGARFNFGKRYEGLQSRDAILRSIARAREIGWHARLHVAGDDI